jgi:hypothetical protein
MARLGKDEDGWPVLLAEQPPAKPGRWARIPALRRADSRDQAAEPRTRQLRRSRSV